jgi:hypothetical protein
MNSVKFAYAAVAVGLLSGLVLGVGLLSGLVLGEENRTSPGQATQAVLNVDEGAQDLQRDFDRLDANGDGFISSNEAYADPGVEEQFERADRNQDGKLDLAEYQELMIGMTRVRLRK